MSARAKFASPQQTKRWLRCINAWAKANDKSQDDMAQILDFSCRSSWCRLKTGQVKRVNLETLKRTTADLGLDINYINGVFNYKNKFSEYKNVFSEFKQTYAAYASAGQQYHASQLVRKAALFLYEALVPKDLYLKLNFDNKKNEFESIKLFCSADEIEIFVIDIYGGSSCIRFSLSRNIGSMLLPIMEGDFDAHAVASIKLQLSHKKKIQKTTKKNIDKFELNAKKLSDNINYERKQ